MPQYVNVNGVWRSVQDEYANVNGIWKTSYSKYLNVNGVWKEEQPKLRLYGLSGGAYGQAEYLSDQKCVKISYSSDYSQSGFGFKVDPIVQFTTPFVLRFRDLFNRTIHVSYLAVDFLQGHNSSGDLVQFSSQDISVPKSDQSPINFNLTEAGGSGSRNHRLAELIFVVRNVGSRGYANASFLLQDLTVNGTTYQFIY